MRKQWPYHALAVVAASAALGVLVFKLEVAGPGRHSEIVTELQHLKKYDSAVNKNVLHIRSGLLKHYDPLVATGKEMSSVIARLEDQEAGIVGKGNADIDQLVKQYAGLQSKRANLVERFKAKNSTLRNSLFYFPSAAALFVRHAKENGAAPNLVSSVEQLLQHLLSFYVNSNSAAQARVRTDLHEVSRLAGDASEPLQRELQALMKHASIVLWHKKEVDDLLRQITSSESESVADSLVHVYQLHYQEQQKVQELSRAAFYVGATALVCYIVFLMVGWARSSLDSGDDALRAMQQRSSLASS